MVDSCPPSPERASKTVHGLERPSYAVSTSTRGRCRACALLQLGPLLPPELGSLNGRPVDDPPHGRDGELLVRQVAQVTKGLVVAPVLTSDPRARCAIARGVVDGAGANRCVLQVRAGPRRREGRQGFCEGDPLGAALGASPRVPPPAARPGRRPLRVMRPWCG